MALSCVLPGAENSRLFHRLPAQCSCIFDPAQLENLRRNPLQNFKVKFSLYIFFEKTANQYYCSTLKRPSFPNFITCELRQSAEFTIKSKFLLKFGHLQLKFFEYLIRAFFQIVAQCMFLSLFFGVASLHAIRGMQRSLTHVQTLREH